MGDFSEAPGIVALAAAALALAAFAWAAALHLRVRRLRADQRVVLGDGDQDLVAHAATLTEAFDALQERVEEVAEGMEERMAGAEDRLDGAIAYRALVRYDAYGELS